MRGEGVEQAAAWTSWARGNPELARPPSGSCDPGIGNTLSRDSKFLSSIRSAATNTTLRRGRFGPQNERDIQCCASRRGVQITDPPVRRSRPYNIYLLVTSIDGWAGNRDLPPLPRFTPLQRLSLGQDFERTKGILCPGLPRCTSCVLAVGHAEKDCKKSGNHVPRTVHIKKKPRWAVVDLCLFRVP